MRPTARGHHEGPSAVGWATRVVGSRGCSHEASNGGAPRRGSVRPPRLAFPIPFAFLPTTSFKRCRVSLRPGRAAPRRRTWRLRVERDWDVRILALCFHPLLVFCSFSKNTATVDVTLEYRWGCQHDDDSSHPRNPNLLSTRVHRA